MVYRNVGFLQLKHALIIISRLLHPHWQLAPVHTTVWHLMPRRYANVKAKVNLVWLLSALLCVVALRHLYIEKTTP